LPTAKTENSEECLTCENVQDPDEFVIITVLLFRKIAYSTYLGYFGKKFYPWTQQADRVKSGGR